MKVTSITFELLFASVALTGCATSPGSSDGLTSITDEAPAATPAAQTFTPLTTEPTWQPDVAQVLTDGRVIVQAYSTDTWYALTPDNTGSYINGTWSQLASDPGGYAPLFYASAVIPDGRFFVGGGEYQAGSPVWQKTAAIYDPVKNTWASVTMPAGWTYFGDGQSLVLPDGRYMVADCCDGGGNAAILNPTNLTWTTTNVGTGKGDDNYDEEGWTLLPNGKVLTVDALDVTANVQDSEMLDPSTLAWTSAGVVGVQLADNDPSRDNGQASEELGAQVLRPDGTVIAFGALGPNAVYNSNTKVWSAAPTFPSGLDCADAPAALEPNGDVLVATSPGLFMTGAVFFEWDGTTMNQLTGPSDAGDNSSYEYNMVVLPTGQIMVTSQSAINIYTPSPATSTALAAIEPVITAVPVLKTTAGFTDGELADIRANEAKPLPTSLAANVDLLPLMDIYTGRTYSVAGARLNGISLGAAYGDDAQSATDFPLVRFTNQTTNHVQYGRTHDGSNYSIAATATGTTNVDVPTTIEKGLAKMQVVANGIASPAILVNVK
jgi:hypothetical protein